MQGWEVMSSTFVVVLGLVLVTLVAALLWWRGPGRTARLRHRYLRKLHMPRGPAEEALRRNLQRVQQRFPGRTEAWYFDWLLKELSRDRR